MLLLAGAAAAAWAHVGAARGARCPPAAVGDAPALTLALLSSVLRGRACFLTGLFGSASWFTANGA